MRVATQNPLPPDAEIGSSQVVELRMNNGASIAGGLSLFMVGLLWVAYTQLPREQDGTMQAAANVLLILLCIFFGGLGIYLIALQMRWRVIADVEKLRWRGAGRWRSVYWTEVRDYYERNLVNSATTLMIETDAGKISFGSDSLQGQIEFKTCVQQRADHALTRSWGHFGCRPEDNWPRLFTSYDRVRIWRQIWMWILITGFLIVCPGLSMATKPHREMFAPGWQWSLAAFLVMEILILCYCLIPLSILKSLREALHREHHRIVLNFDSYLLEDGMRRLQGKWEEIEGWKIRSSRSAGTFMREYQIETEAGTFRFNRCLHDSTLLTEIITQKVGRKPEIIDEDSLDILEPPSADTHTYTYRTRTIRAMLIMWILCAILMSALPIVPYFMSPGPQAAQMLPFLVLIAVGTLVYTLYYLYQYRHEKIVTDAEGITEYRLFGNKQVQWHEIESFALHPNAMIAHGEVVGKKDRVCFRLTIGHLPALKAEIARRAVNSTNREWE